MAKRPQRSRSSKLTGGEGFTYEDLVVAYYLTALLREESAMATRGVVVRVAVQQHRQGEPMDDLVVDSEAAGQQTRTSLQVKSKVVISKNDSDFKAIMAEAVATRKKPDFRVGSDRYGFVAETVAIGRFEALSNIISRAVASTNGADFASRFVKGGESSVEDISLREELLPLTQAGNSQEEWEFYRHFVGHRFDNLASGGDRYADLTNRLGEISTSGGENFAEVLARHVRAGEGSARVWKRNELINEMRTLVKLRIAPVYEPDIAILTDLAKDAVADIRDDIAGFTVDRPALLTLSEEAVARHVLTNISGLPGCGKSVVLRRYVERAMKNGPVLFLKSDRLEGANWRSFARHHGLIHHTAAALLGEIGGSGTPILFIDGVDRINQENRGIITDLLHAIERETELAHWRVLVTSRDQGLEVLRSWISRSLYATGGIGNVTVGVLDDEEATVLAKQHTALQPLLLGVPAVREIARRPFFAAVLADQASSLGFDQGAPQTESELIEAWWRAGGHNVEPEAADARQRAILDFAEMGASSLGKDIHGRAVKPESIAQLQGLRRDRIIDAVEAGTAYKFTHDIFFEWAFYRLLIDKRGDWPDALVAAGEPPLLARIVGLLSQRDYERGHSWGSTFAELTQRHLRPQWRRDWLLGPSASGRFLEHVAAFDALTSADQHALLHKFLVWFQAERTIPSPVVLQSLNLGFESSMLVRAADMLGWPSDVPTWRRVLEWVFARHIDFPAQAIPHVVDLFGVWQNLCADFPNAPSAKLIAICEEWLIDLETKSSERWAGLRSDTLDSLAGDLRKLILRAARSYPEPAGRALDRLMVWERRENSVLKSVFALSGLLAQSFPEKLAQLVRVEVLRELPKEERDRKRRRDEEYFANLKAVRDKPEQDRSEAEKRMLNHSHMFHSIGTDHYNLDHIGVDRGHNLFYPQSPAHEPFDGLFQSAPHVARSLVRDIANHATTGLRQIYEINCQKLGTLIPIQINFPWGPQTFWGNQRSYSWYFGEGGPLPVEAAYLALTQWAHKRLDDGADLAELIQQVTEGHEGIAALGLAVSLVIERNERSPALRALLVSQRLWSHDHIRHVQEGSRDINLFGLDPRARMNPKQREGDAYLKGRSYRKSSLKDLAYLYALSEDEGERTSFMTDIGEFPAKLPYQFEEEVGNEVLETEMRERAQGWAQFANKDNYQLVNVRENESAAQVIYRNPTKISEARKEKLEENAKTLHDFNIVAWAADSLSKGIINVQATIKTAVAFARTRDDPSLLLRIEEAGAEIGIRQAAVVACAAAVIRFDSTAENLEWAWSIMDRMAEGQEPKGLYGYSKYADDPRNYYMAALKRDLESNSPRPTSASRLLTLAADPNPNISQTAFTGLFDARVMPESLVWNAGVLASELFANHFSSRSFDDDGEDMEASSHREAALRRAIERLDAPESKSTFIAPPQPWVRSPERLHRGKRYDDDSQAWTYPEFDIDPQYAAGVMKLFPIEAWGESDAYRPQILAFTGELISWTAERMFPSFGDEKDDPSTQLYEWLDALAGLVARVIVHTSTDAIAHAFVEPLIKHKHRDVLQFIDVLTDHLTCRFIYDAPVLSERALGVLKVLMNRMLDEGDFSPDSYRSGEIRDRHLNSMIRSFMLTSAKECPGAARFANGKWDDLPMLFGQIDRLMTAAGWVDSVMDQFLILSERAGSLMPIQDFERLVSVSMDAEGFRLERWKAADIPASISGVIQSLAHANYPLTHTQARGLLVILDRLVDSGDRRAAALQKSEHFRGIQVKGMVK
ncbi:hypothetical protein [Pseudomonas sp. NY15374]|uniref:hypothetical protein n=1 Tax=Pseudomonas sp. NY15374 TaxID=3400357 RepID=UPI003A8A165E